MHLSRWQVMEQNKRHLCAFKVLNDTQHEPWRWWTYAAGGWVRMVTVSAVPSLWGMFQLSVCCGQTRLCCAGGHERSGECMVPQQTQPRLVRLALIPAMLLNQLFASPHLPPHPGFAGNCTMAAGRYDAGCAEEQLQAAGVDVAAGGHSWLGTAQSACRVAVMGKHALPERPARVVLRAAAGHCSARHCVPPPVQQRASHPHSPPVSGCMGSSDDDRPHEVMEASDASGAVA